MKKATIIFYSILISLLTSCGPGHHLAYKQFSTNNTGVILSVQGYALKASEKEILKQNWNALAAEMKKQPGFISSYLSSGLGESTLWLSHSEWESIEALRNAFSNSRILELEAKLRDKQFEHLFSLGKEGQYIR